jgi:hypothetical protein
MCGIVHRPTRRKHFEEERQKGAWQNLPLNTVLQISYLCEETHIPERACEVLLTLASNHLMAGEKFVSSIPFAIYSDGKRLVSQQSIADEQDVMHLAMAGSTLFFINQELQEIGLKVVMGHCCDIQMHSLAEEAECMKISHESNVWRATKLRNLTDANQIIVSDDDFINMSVAQKVTAYA